MGYHTERTASGEVVTGSGCNCQGTPPEQCPERIEWVHANSDVERTRNDALTVAGFIRQVNGIVEASPAGIVDLLDQLDRLAQAAMEACYRLRPDKPLLTDTEMEQRYGHHDR